MQAKGIPDTLTEATDIVEQTAGITQNTSTPGHWPHSQIVSLAKTVSDLQARVDQLEAKPKRGRPPKDRIADAEVDRVRAELAA